MRKKFGGMFLMFFVVGGLSFLLYREWGRFGIVEDSAAEGGFQAMREMDKPVIYAADRKVVLGEEIRVEDLGSAYDSDGTSLQEYLEVKAVSGTSAAIDTDRAGIYDRILRVQSPVSGKVCEKRIRILVDGKAEGK